MVEKYGQGEITIQKCQTCGNEQMIRSAGVHVTEGGSVMVFADQDEFSCPRCGSDEFDELSNGCSGKWYEGIKHIY